MSNKENYMTANLMLFKNLMEAKGYKHLQSAYIRGFPDLHFFIKKSGVILIAFSVIADDLTLELYSCVHWEPDSAENIAMKTPVKAWSLGDVGFWAFAGMPYTEEDMRIAEFEKQVKEMWGMT